MHAQRTPKLVSPLAEMAIESNTDGYTEVTRLRLAQRAGTVRVGVCLGILVGEKHGPRPH